MRKPQQPLCPGQTYCIFNEAVGKDLFFMCEKDCLTFLNRLKKYILPVCDIFSYCLMQKHFHMVVRIKSADQIESFLLLKFGEKKFTAMKKKKNFSLNHYITRQYSNFFNSYAKYYNFCYKRMGTLFRRTFGRKNLDTKDSIRKVVCNTHNNPVAAGLVPKPEDWKYSSYAAIISEKVTLLARTELIFFFGSLEDFIESHRK